MMRLTGFGAGFGLRGLLGDHIAARTRLAHGPVEFGGADRLDVDDEAIGAGPGSGRQDEALGHLHRLADVEDDARGGRREPAEAQARDQAPAVERRAVRDLPVDLGHVDDDTIGVGQGEDLDLEIGADVDHQARARLVVGNAGARGLRRGCRGRQGQAEQSGPKG